jgi:uncharacterized membrane protein
MAIILDGSTGISSIGTLTGVTSISSAAANTPVVMQDSGSNTNTCRAWVNFDGTGTVAIRASFNVTSITDNGTGDYTVNFTVAMPDINYSVVIGHNQTTTGNANNTVEIYGSTTSSLTTTSLRVWSGAPSSGAFPIDRSVICVSIFR